MFLDDEDEEGNNLSLSPGNSATAAYGRSAPSSPDPSQSIFGNNSGFLSTSGRSRSRSRSPSVASPTNDNLPSPNPQTRGRGRRNSTRGRTRRSASYTASYKADKLWEQKMRTSKAKEKNYLEGARANVAARIAFEDQSAMMKAAAKWYERENEKATNNGGRNILYQNLHNNQIRCLTF